MFDKMLDSRRLGAEVQSWWSLPIAVLVHAALVGGVLFVSLLAVRGVQEPRLPLILVRIASPPLPELPAPSAAAPAARAGSTTQGRPDTAHPEEPVQPTNVPDRIADDPGAGDVEDLGIGVGDGTGDGVPDGVPDGLPQGVPHGTPGGSGSGGPLIPGAGGVTMPELILASQVHPGYPELARVSRHEGTVILQAVIEPDGTVGEVEVLRCNRPRFGFEDAAVEAVRRWRYKPATQNGRAVAVYFTVVVDFRLR